MAQDLALSPVTLRATPGTESTELRSLQYSKKAEAPEKFEAFVLQSFIQEMLPKDTENVFGGGLAGEYWRSMMAEQLGGVMAKGGGIGIAKYLTHGYGSVASTAVPDAQKIGAQRVAEALLDTASPATTGE